MPGILSLSNEFMVCEFCDEVFEWNVIDPEDERVEVIELGHWPGDGRKIQMLRNRYQSQMKMEGQ